MPAVNPTRLRFQIQDLLVDFYRPPVFHRRLQELFSFYANRTLKFGDIPQQHSYLPAYHLPQPVVRQLKLDLVPAINEQPGDALALADELWLDPYFEIRQIAIYILGVTPVDQPDPILERLQRWLSPELDRSLSSDLFSTGTQYLQETFPSDWESFIQSLLSMKQVKMVAAGIAGLSEGLKNPSFQNLPAVFRLLSPFLRQPEPGLMIELENLIEALAEYSPTETAFFLRQSLAVSDSSKTLQIVKESLSFFPVDIQEDLKSSLKQ